MIGLCLLLRLAEAREGWVRIVDADAAATARDAGLSFREGHAGDWYAVEGDVIEGAVTVAGLPWSEVPPEVWKQRVARVHGPRAVEGDALARPGLPTADEVGARLEALVSAGHGELVDLGRSVLGAPIVAWHAGDAVGTGRVVRVLGAHHGDEGSSAEVALAFAEALAARGTPPGLEVWVVPLVNPDGTAARTRHNANDVDLNRNYGLQWSPSEYASGEGPFSEPETRAVRALARSRGWLGGMSLHSGEVNLGWVWNWTRTERPPEEVSLRALGERYADACSAPDFWLTNGADWYVTRGDTTDWTYGARGEPDLTLELTLEKSPPAEDIATYVEWHLDALLQWATRPPDHATLVVDALTNEPVEATISAPGMRTAWTGPDGSWARWELPGLTDAVVSAPGYVTAPMAQVTRLERAVGGSALLDLRPEPVVLGRLDGLQRVRLGEISGPLRLVMPGNADVRVEGAVGGGWDVDPATLAPGAWTMVTEAGVAPRALLVGELDDAVAIAGVAVAGSALQIDGNGFGRGAQAWALAGTARAMRALPLLAQDERSLRFAWPIAADRPVDLLLYAGGRWVVVADAEGAAVVDVAAPSASPLDGTLLAPGVCGTSAPASSSGVLLAGLLLAGRRRRRA